MFIVVALASVVGVILAVIALFFFVAGLMASASDLSDHKPKK